MKGLSMPSLGGLNDSQFDELIHQAPSRKQMALITKLENQLGQEYATPKTMDEASNMIGELLQAVKEQREEDREWEDEGYMDCGMAPWEGR